MEKKLNDARSEVEDITHEFHRERQGLLENIREQRQQLKLLEQVMGMVLPTKEISKVRPSPVIRVRKHSNALIHWLRLRE